MLPKLLLLGVLCKYYHPSPWMTPIKAVLVVFLMVVVERRLKKVLSKRKDYIFRLSGALEGISCSLLISMVGRECVFIPPFLTLLLIDHLRFGDIVILWIHSTGVKESGSRRKKWESPIIPTCNFVVREGWQFHVSIDKCCHTMNKHRSHSPNTIHCYHGMASSSRQPPSQHRSTIIILWEEVELPRSNASDNNRHDY